MKPLILSTKKSVYKPIEIEVDGVKYAAKPINRTILEEMGKLEREIRSGDAQKAYDQVELVFGHLKVFDRLDLRQINEIVNYVTNALFKPERLEKKDPEKNESGPGEKE